jgi:hypothetical protein
VIQQYMRRIYRAMELPRLRSLVSRFGLGLTTAAVVLVVIVLTPTPDHEAVGDSVSTRDNAPPVRTVLMRDVTLESGVIFSHLQGDEHLTGLNETLGPGACAFDFDNDGWTDLFLVNGTGQSRYYGSGRAATTARSTGGTCPRAMRSIATRTTADSRTFLRTRASPRNPGAWDAPSVISTTTATPTWW